MDRGRLGAIHAATLEFLVSRRSGFQPYEVQDAVTAQAPVPRATKGLA